MSKVYKLHIDGIPLKKDIKNKPLQKIKESSFDIETKIYKNGKVKFTMEVDCMLQPYARPRRGSRGFYDPLESYKKYIIKVILQFLDENNSLKEIFPAIGEIHSNILIVEKPPKSWSNIKKYKAINKMIYHEGFPDIDNVEKLAWDVLSDSGIIYNDKAVNKSRCTKEYGLYDHTIVTLYIIPKKDDNDKTRLSKEENEYIKSLYT